MQAESISVFTEAQNVFFILSAVAELGDVLTGIRCKCVRQS
jgi:hypothetical protein